MCLRWHPGQRLPIVQRTRSEGEEGGPYQGARLVAKHNAISSAHLVPDFPVHEGPGIWTWEEWDRAVMGAILKELRILNATLNCHRVPAGMDALVRIDRRLANRLPMKPRKARRKLK